jgi:hypothetical protein
VGARAAKFGRRLLTHIEGRGATTAYGQCRQSRSCNSDFHVALFLFMVLQTLLKMSREFLMLS